MNYNLGTYMPGWEIENLIGEGSFGKVYKIVRNNFGIEEYCALKIISIPQSKAELQSIRNDGMDDDSVTEYYRGLVEDFVQEIAMLSKLKGNQNIVSYEDYSVVPHEDGIGWDILIRMELLTALPIYFNNNSMSEKEVVKLAIDICNALEICHAQKIIHRDIKIDNIFISQNGNYKLGDFGVARNIEKTVSGLSKKGTYTYMAPEVYKGDAYNENVDLYSLGIVMYKLLNNNREPFLPPFPEVIKYSVKNEALVRRMRGETILPPQNASEAVGRIILKACEFNSNSRYQKPSEMKMDLMSVLKDWDDEQPQAQTEVLGFDEVDDEGTTLLDETSNEVEGTVALDKDYAALEETMLLPEDEDEGTALLVEDDTEGTMVLDEADFDFEETAVLNEDQQVEVITQLDGSIGYRHKEEAEEKELPEYYDKDYQTAVSKIENSESEQDYYDGIKIMQSLAEDKYLPAVEYLQNKDNLKKDFSKDGEDVQEKPNNNTKISRKAIAILLALLIALGAGAVFVEFGIPEIEYNKALTAMEECRYPYAIDNFIQLGDYKDCNIKVKECKYQYALVLMQSDEYSQAIKLFSEVKDYKDCKSKIIECKYQIACTKLNEKEYFVAIDSFKKLGEYKDSKSKIDECKYRYVKDNQNREDMVTYKYLKALKKKDYKDSAKIFKNLYKWKIKLECFNTDPDDHSTISSSIPDDPNYLHFEFYLYGGEPGESINLYHVDYYPDGEKISSDWQWEDSVDGDLRDCYWSEGVTTSTGTLTIEIRNAKDDSLIGEFSILVK